MLPLLYSPPIPSDRHIFLLSLLRSALVSINRSEVTLLALFDVSAAFDTVDHQILLQRLSISFGLSGNILGWLTSFLQDCSFMVVHGSTRSRWVLAPLGLPQGSVLRSPPLHNFHCRPVTPACGWGCLQSILC